MDIQETSAVMFMPFEQKQPDEECMWSTARGRHAETHLPSAGEELFWSAPQQNQITLSLFFCFLWRDNRAAEGVHVQCPLSAAPTPAALIEALSVHVWPR